MKIPKGWRKLRKGEAIQVGDVLKIEGETGTLIRRIKKGKQ